MLGTAFNSWHRLGVIGEKGFDGGLQGLRHLNVSPLVASDVPRFARIKMVLASFALQNFASPRNGYAFGSGFVGFHGHSWAEEYIT
jgi:hypothetical protein